MHHAVPIERYIVSMQVKANNIVRIPAHQLASSLYTPAQQQDWHCTIGKQPDLLSSLCDALQACVERPLQQDTLLALLLSAVSAGHASPAATTASTASAFTSQQVGLGCTAVLDSMCIRILILIVRPLSAADGAT